MEQEPTSTPSLNEDLQDLAPLQIIRTESELSKYPIHNLSKKGTVNIEIKKLKPDGQLDVKWEVSFSDKHGQARQLAYKLDTLVINRHIDELGRPLPEVIKIGSLREVADELDLGGNTNKVKKSLMQNAMAFITAKLRYKGNDGSEKSLEAVFNRYSIVFTGETLPDGRKADAVYLILNKIYRDVLNSAPVRPLNYEYLKSLTPGAQRFYEIISRNIFAALSKGGDRAYIRYSDYCMYSAQMRYYDYEHFRVQMAKIHRAHLKSHYITDIEYEQKTDSNGNIDWLMKYTPGPKARAEYHAFTKDPKAFLGRPSRRGRPRKGESLAAALSDPAPLLQQPTEPAKVNRYWEGKTDIDMAAPSLVPEPPIELFADDRQQSLDLAPDVPIDPLLVSELARRGISETEGRKLLQKVPVGHPVMDVLEWGDYQIEEKLRAGNPMGNPAGFHIWLLQTGTLPPATFETSCKKRARLEAMKAQEREQNELRAAEAAYEEYRNEEITKYTNDPANARHIEELHTEQLLQNRTRFPQMTAAQLDQLSAIGARYEVRKGLEIMTLEEFYRTWKNPGVPTA